MNIAHTPNPDCGVHYLSRKHNGKGFYNSRIVCKNIDVGDTITSHTAMLNGGNILAEVKEVTSKEIPKGAYGDGFYLYDVVTFIDISSIPPEMVPKSF